MAVLASANHLGTFDGPSLRLHTILKSHLPGPIPHFPTLRPPVPFILVSCKLYPENANVRLSLLGSVYALGAFLFLAVRRFS